MNIFLAEITAYDPGTSGVITYRYASSPGYDNAGTFYAPRLESPATLSRSIDPYQPGGRASASYGELTLINNDGALNAMADDYFDGRTLTLKYGDSAADYGSFVTLLVATIDTVAMEHERISVRLRDRAIELDKPYSTTKYAGNNSLPLGIEGTADDIKDQFKPVTLGRVALMHPVLVNTSKLIYQVSKSAIAAIPNVYDSGAYLDYIAGDYTDQTDMETNAPASGGYRVCPSLGFFRLGSQPVGQLSACVVESWTYTDNSAAGLIQRILTSAGYTSADWVAADFTALNAANAGSLGLLIEGGETIASVLDRICSSVGAWWGCDRLNRFRFARFSAPSGSPVVTLTDSDILSLERLPPNGKVMWSTTLKADANYAVQDKKSLAGVVPADRAAWFSLATRDQKTEDAAVKTSRLLAEEQSFDSVFNGIATAKAETTRRQALFASRRDTVQVQAPNATTQFQSIDLGSVVTVQTARFGYTSGRLMTVIGIQPDFAGNTLDLTLWG